MKILTFEQWMHFRRIVEVKSGYIYAMGPDPRKIYTSEQIWEAYNKYEKTWKIQQIDGL